MHNYKVHFEVKIVNKQQQQQAVLLIKTNCKWKKLKLKLIQLHEKKINLEKKATRIKTNAFAFAFKCLMY